LSKEGAVLNRKLSILILLFGFCIVSFTVGGRTDPATSQKDNSTIVGAEVLDVYYFFGDGCSHCSRVRPFLSEMKLKYAFQLHEYDIFSNRSTLSLFDDYSARYGLPLESRGVPAVFISDTYFVGDSPIIEGFEEATKRALQEGVAVDHSKTENVASHIQEPTPSADSLSILTITAAALADSVSPCSIAILVFLIGARVLVADRSKRALKVGLAYCLSVFIAYLSFGLGLLSVVQFGGFSFTFSIMVGLFAVLVGMLYLKDVFWYDKGGFVMEVPHSLKPLLMKMVKSVTNPLGAFAIGFVAAFFELPCTGGPYIFILGQLADTATRTQAIPLLVYYNLIFVLPLVIISLLLYSNLFSIGKVREWTENNKQLFKLAGGLTMVTLGFLAVPSTLMLRFTQLFLIHLRVVGPLLLVIIVSYFAGSFMKRKSIRSSLKGGLLILLLLPLAFFSVQVKAWAFGEPMWQFGDINQDGIVDMHDLYILGQNYGKTFSPDPDVVYVSDMYGDDADTSCGLGPNLLGYTPCKSISRGIERAAILGRSEVHVSDGVYEEAVTLVEGISIRGGYMENSWGRHLYSTNTIIKGNTSTGHKKTIIASDITGLTTMVEGFVIYGQNNYETSGNSYAVWIKDSPAVSILSNQIIAGDGGNGPAGSDGSNGMDGVSGSPGPDAYEPTAGYDCYDQCSGTGSENLGGLGGSRTCGALSVSGGAGGTADCPDFDETRNNCLECAQADHFQTLTTSGSNGPNGGGAGGIGGYDGYLDYLCNSDCSLHLPDRELLGEMYGADGSDGTDGTDGLGGAGCASPSGSVVGNEWVGASCSSGSSGSHGRGGGGGGAGGGVETYYDISCSSAGRSDIGGSGGGGGSGGCGGSFGTGGGAGGGSFGIFVVFTSPPGSNIPIIDDNTIQRGNGGNGGRGGNGGTGGIGGSGASGGAGGQPGTSYWGAGGGGAGGDGGNGGHGGGGGGGCGGVSYNIYSFGHGSSDLNAWKMGNGFVDGGSGGSGGTGGLSMSNPGDPGSNGLEGDCNF